MEEGLWRQTNNLYPDLNQLELSDSEEPHCQKCWQSCPKTKMKGIVHLDNHDPGS